ncbi:ankyrin repeat domain-containing protein [Providencia sp. Me31A]|uniref:ankyrin repeat domain-containing protein n=1 Tax=Providencia sp. Me31A TaxID=3392637 RepID=UPI003D294234
MRFKTLGLALSLVLFTSVSNAKILNEKNPEGYQQFRLDYMEMVDIANKNKLPHRIFYEKPSEGPDAKWFDAVKQGDLDAVKMQIEQGQDIEAKDNANLGQTALGWAAFIGYEDMVDYLIAQKANLWATDNGDVYNALKSASLGKNVNVVKKLQKALEGKFDIQDSSYEDDGETLVMIAASNNRIDIVKYFISQQVDLNVVTTAKDNQVGSFNQSALSYACERGYIDMQKLLVANGAINHRTGNTQCQ